MLLGEQTRRTSSISCAACNSICPCSWATPEMVGRNEAGGGEEMGISPIPHRIQVLQSHVAERGGARGVVHRLRWPVKASDPGFAVCRHCRYAPLNAGFNESRHYK